MTDSPRIPSLPDGLFDHLVGVRRDIHQHPELSFEEHRTGELIAVELEKLGLTPQRGVAGTGVVADIIGDPDGPLVALRADLDALPMTEATGLPFASKNPGVTHSCAHDGHTTILLGAASLLAASPPAGRVRLLFQPAEERGNGAKHLCDAGHMDGVGAIFGIHMDPRWAPGEIVVQSGPVNASTTTIRIFVTGRGSHGARPHLGVDAILVAARIVEGLQSIVSREVHPGQPAVVTVGTFEAGTGHNVLAGEAKLAGTVRCFDDAVRRNILDAIVRVAETTAAAHRATARVEFGEGCAPVINDPGMAGVAAVAAASVVGTSGVHGLPEPNMGGEDFSFYLEHAPGCYARLGGRIAGRDPIPAHNPAFDWDERAIAVGARYFEAVAREAIRALK